MGVFAEIAGELPAECLHDNLIFKYLINKKIEESTAKPTHEFYKFMNDIIPDIPPRRNLMYHMYVSVLDNNIFLPRVTIHAVLCLVASVMSDTLRPHGQRTAHV